MAIRTKHACTAGFRGTVIDVPAYTLLRVVVGGMGPTYAIASERTVAELSGDVWSAKHYHAWVREDDVEVCD